MKKYKFFNDIHKFGCYEIDCQLEFGEDCYYLGDNIDLSCCKKSDVFRALECLEYYKEQFKGRFVSGNHELGAVNHLKVDDILMTHGDYIFWPKIQADAYRNRNVGMSPAMRFLVWLSVGEALSIRNWEISRLMKHRAFKLAKKHKCTTIVMGHWHPRTIQDFTYKGIRVIVLPRGKTEIEL